MLAINEQVMWWNDLSYPKEICGEGENFNSFYMRRQIINIMVLQRIKNTIPTSNRTRRKVRIINHENPCHTNKCKWLP